jgi:hypothetical protein
MHIFKKCFHKTVFNASKGNFTKNTINYAFLSLLAYAILTGIKSWEFNNRLWTPPRVLYRTSQLFCRSMKIYITGLEKIPEHRNFFAGVNDSKGHRRSKPVLWNRNDLLRFRIRLPIFSRFLDFSFSFYVHCSKLLHLPRIRFHCVGGRWDRIQDCCDFDIDSQTL